MSKLRKYTNPKYDPPYPVVLVEWIDSSSQFGWTDYRKDDLMCQSVGYLYKEDENRITICKSVAFSDNKHNMGHHTFTDIPKEAVKRVITLRK